MNKDQIEISGKLLHETDAAYKLFDGYVEVWVPKSLTQYDDNGTFTMPEWLAKEKGLI